MNRTPTFVPASFSDDNAEAQIEPRVLSYGQVLPDHLLQGGEIIILAIKPSVWFLVLVSVRWLLVAAAVVLLAPWFATHYPTFSDRTLTQSALLITAARLLVAMAQWSSRLYVLTNRRVLCSRGITHVSLFEVPLVHIRNTYISTRRLEGWLKVGSIGFSVQGSKRVDAWWEQIANPQEVHDKIRRAIEKALDHHLPY